MTLLEKSVPGTAMQFQISLPMRFRFLGERAWHDAWADSMSATEIIFRGDEAMEIGKALDIQVALPQPGRGRRGGTIVSKAKVTRSWLVSEQPDQPFIAATLTGARLLRSSPENVWREPESPRREEIATVGNPVKRSL